MMRLQGHHALVTGGGTGIGAAIARALASEGAKLTLVGRRREPLEEVASGLSDALVAPADVTDISQVENAFAIARGAQGPITRSEEHTSELQSLMRISYAVFCLKKT